MSTERLEGGASDLANGTSRHSRTVVAVCVVGIRLVGVACRAWLANELAPWGGDPTYLYCDRAMIIVAAVREQCCGYLTFAIATQPRQQDGDSEALEPQPYWFGEHPLRSDLCAMADAPAQYGLRLLGETQVVPGKRVLLFSLAPSGEAKRP